MLPGVQIAICVFALAASVISLSALVALTIELLIDSHRKSKESKESKENKDSG